MDLVFDDQPIESILYDEPGAGPSSASLFSATAPQVSAIIRALDEGAVEEPLRRLASLLARGDLMSQDLLGETARRILALLPQVPCPIIKHRRIPYRELLQPIFAAALAHGARELMEAAGTTLYRFCEAMGRYRDAIDVIATMLERAKGNLPNQAVLTNNLGYDYFLDRDWERAAACFERAVELFTRANDTLNRNNSRLNLLCCRYEQGQTVEGLEREVSELRALLAPSWLQRKALILLARVAEQRGDPKAAIGLVERALAACKKVPSRHRLEDRAYLRRLTGGSPAPGNERALEESR